MKSDMWVVVYCNEGPGAGLVYYIENLDGETKMNEHNFAARVAGSLGMELAPSSGHIPNCCGHLRVEFIVHTPRTEMRDEDSYYLGSTRIWSGESFYFAEE